MPRPAALRSDRRSDGGALVGALNPYARNTDDFDDADAARVVATQAAAAIVRAEMTTAAGRLRDQLRAVYDETVLAARPRRAPAVSASNKPDGCSATSVGTTGDTLVVVAERLLDVARTELPSTS
jgi:hypothetical protein